MMTPGGMPVKRVDRIVASFSGRHSKNSYTVLCRILERALAAMPEERSMGALCQEVSQFTGKKAEAIYKSLSRAVKDIWENGDRKALEQVVGYHLLEEPSPKELVMSLTQALWSQEPAVEYHLLEGGLERKVGVWAQTGDGDYLVMQPFSRDRTAVCRLVEQWNREQMPVQKFREMILLGELMKS